MVHTLSWKICLGIHLTNFVSIDGLNDVDIKLQLVVLFEMLNFTFCFKAAMKTIDLKGLPSCRKEYGQTVKDLMIMCYNYFEDKKLNLLLCVDIYLADIKGQTLHLFLELCLHLNIIVGRTHFSLKHLTPN